MQPRRLRSALLIAPLALTLVSAAGCKKPETKAAEAPSVLTVSTEAAAVHALPRQLELTGSVAAWDQMPVMPAANGLRIMQVLVDEGAVVQKGQLLAKLDDATLNAQMAQAKARVATARAQLASAEDTYARFASLAKEGGVSASELVARRTAVETGSAQLAEARAAVGNFEALLAQTRVVAPDAGLVIKRDAHIGDVSTVGRALFTMVRDRRLEVQAQVPESDLGQVKKGQPAKISSDARVDLVATGHVREVSPALDTGNRQATVKIELPVGTPFQVGMFVRAAVDLGTHEALAVPTKAVVSGTEGSQVFVLDDKFARARQVVVGARAGDWVEVRDGLKAGEPIIVNGVGFLKDGDKVDVAPALTSDAK